MSRKVFISHASEDSKIAEQVCLSLESAGIQCWIAPRDIISGEKWTEAIATAVLSSAVMVVIFSGNANQSKHVAHELTMAYSKGIQVIPYKIEAVEPSGALQFYLTGAHWLEVDPLASDDNFEQLAALMSAYVNPPPNEDKITTSPAAAKAKWADIVLAFVLLSLVGMAAMIYFFDQPVPLDSILHQGIIDEMDEEWHVRGNSTGNIANLGLVTEVGNWVYFSNVGKGYHLYRMHPDGTMVEQLNEDQSLYINVVEDWVYYINGSDYDKIYRIKIDGSEKERLSEKSSAYLQVVGDWLFCSDFSDGGHGHVYKINLNSGDSRVVFRYGGAHLNFTAEHIYFINREESERVYRLNLAGFNERVDSLDSYRVGSLLVSEPGFYFVNASMEEELWAVIGSGEAHKLADGPVKFINCDDHGLYYIKNWEDAGIHRIDFDGQNMTKLNNSSELQPFYLNVAGDWLYFIDRSSRVEQLYRIHIDGGDPELVGVEVDGS